MSCTTVCHLMGFNGNRRRTSCGLRGKLALGRRPPDPYNESCVNLEYEHVVRILLRHRDVEGTAARLMDRGGAVLLKRGQKIVDWARHDIDVDRVDVGGVEDCAIVSWLMHAADRTRTC